MKPIRCLLGRHTRQLVAYTHTPCPGDNREYGYRERRCLRCQPPAPETRPGINCRCRLPRDHAIGFLAARLDTDPPDPRYARLFDQDLIVFRRRTALPEHEISGHGYTHGGGIIGTPPASWTEQQETR